MKLNTQTINALADRLEGCQLQQQDTPKITDDHPDMDWDDAYAIQDEIRGATGPWPAHCRSQGRPDLARQDEANGRQHAGVRLHDR